MKRDMDLIREILLLAEADPLPRMRVLPQIDGYTKTQLVEHARLLTQAGLITSKTYRDEDGPGVISVQLTWNGHEFIESVRDPEIWKKTKAGAEKVGTWSIKLLGEMASGFVRAKAAEMGLPIA